MAGIIKPSRRIPFAYRPGTNIFYRIPAGLKLFCVIIFSAAAFTSLWGLAVSAALLCFISAAARISPWELLAGSGPLFVLSLCILLFNTFQPDSGINTPEIIIGNNIYIPDLFIPGISASGFRLGIIAALRIFVPYAAAALLFAVTTTRQIRLSLAVVELYLRRLFFKKVYKKKGGAEYKAGEFAYISLGLALMLGFIPRFFDLWETANLACRARSCNGIRRLLTVIPLVTERMIESAAAAALALEARALGQLPHSSVPRPGKNLTE